MSFPKWYRPKISIINPFKDWIGLRRWGHLRFLRVIFLRFCWLEGKDETISIDMDKWAGTECPKTLLHVKKGKRG